MSHFSFAFGIGSQSSQGDWLEVFYPQPILNPSANLVAAIAGVLGSQLASGNHVLQINTVQASQLAEACTIAGSPDQAKWLTQAADHGQTDQASQQMVITLLETDSGPQSTPEVYLKLQLLSNGLKQPNSMDLTGIFGLLPNVAWTNEGAIAIEDITQRQMDARLRGEWLHVNAVDKFPRMTDYAVPKGIRIGDASRVRLGAHVAPGPPLCTKVLLTLTPAR
jgi:2,3,4,5-tetrahydropyridine-2-carboxylate N-succinyltransferase